MVTRPLLVGASCAFLSAWSAFAQDVPAPNVEIILKELDQIEHQQKMVIQNARQAALAKLKAATSSGPAAVNLYEEAVEATQFEGKKGKGATFADWKEMNADLLGSKGMQTVVMLHLKYLVLSLERKASGKPELFVQPSLAFAVEVFSADQFFLKQAERSEVLKEEKALGDRQSIREKEDQAVLAKLLPAKKEILDKPITESVFTKWLRLGPWLPKGDDWEAVASNIPGILEKNVRPFLRETKNPQLLETWEFEMKILADRATFGRLEHEVVEFNAFTRPRLQFSRANDMIELGQKNRGVTEIYGMIKTYPQHPDFAKWVQRLRDLLKPAAPAEAAPAPEAAATSPAPGTSPQ